MYFPLYILIQLYKKFPSHMNAHISWTAIRKQEVKCLKFKNWLIACLLYDVNEGRSINKRDGQTWRDRLLVLRGLRTLHTLTQEKWISFAEKRLILIPRGTEICREMSCFSRVLLWTRQGFFCLSWNEFEGNVWVFLGQSISVETAFLVLLIPTVQSFGF